MSVCESPRPFLNEVTLCCWLRAGETVLSYKSCPLPSAFFCCFSWLVSRSLFWGLRSSLDLFISPSNIHRTSQTLRKGKKKGGQQLSLILRTVWKSVHWGLQWTGQSPGSLDSGPETWAFPTALEPPDRSAHCLGHKPVREGSWQSLWHKALSHPVRWSTCPSQDPISGGSGQFTVQVSPQMQNNKVS